MVNVSIDVTDLGGEARPGDKVVLWRPRMGGSATHAGRVISTAPVTVFLTDGKATVSDVEPGEMTVLLQCRGVESQGPITVGVPDGNGTVTLRALLESQFEYAPPIVSAVQEAASNALASEEAAIQAQIRSEAAADRADAKVDDAINNGAALVRDEVKQDADRAVAARQAATQSESNAKTSETNAKQSEDNAGNYAAVATTAATEAVDAMESANSSASSIEDIASAVAGHADRAEQYESGAATYAQNATDAADRVGTAEQVGVWAQQAQDAADRIGTAETVEGWVVSAQNSASAAALSETKAEEYRDAALSAADSASDAIGELTSIETDASTSASNAKVSETNAATHEANSLSAAERAEFAAEETIQQVTGDFATRNYVDSFLANTFHIDTAVGTRVFAGDIMIYGDTGWRDITDEYLAVQQATGSVLELGEGAKILVRKTHASLSFGFQGDIMASRSWTNLFELTASFMPNIGHSVPMPTGGRLERNGSWMRLMGAPIGSIAAAGRVSVATFPHIATNWPTTLPGTPL